MSDRQAKNESARAPAAPEPRPQSPGSRMTVRDPQPASSGTHAAAPAPQSLGAHAATPKFGVDGRQVREELGPDDRAIKRERIVDVLWELQQKRGWLDDEAIRLAAAECALTPQEVDEVATFYNLLLRQPVGRRVIYACDSISCHLTGADALIEQLSAELGIKPGETTADGEFTLLPIVCLGHCEKAPCLLAGETVHGPLRTDPESVRALIQRIRDERSAARSQG